MAEVGELNDPDVAARIGPYEEYEPLDLERAPLKLGTEGIWAGNEDEPIAWSSIRAVRARRVDVESVSMAFLAADVTTTAYERMLCAATPGEAFDERASLIATRFQQYCLDHGIPSAAWPSIDLEVKAAEPASANRLRAIANEELASFAEAFPDGQDPILGHFVAIPPEPHWIRMMAILSAVGIVAGPIMLLLHAENAWLVALIGTPLGTWLAIQLVPLWHTWRWLRVGQDGIEVVPGLKPTKWKDITSISLVGGRFGGPRLKVKVTGRHGTSSLSFSLIPPQAPLPQGIRNEWSKTQWLIDRLSSAAHEPE